MIFLPRIPCYGSFPHSCLMSSADSLNESLMKPQIWHVHTHTHILENTMKCKDTQGTEHTHTHVETLSACGTVICCEEVAYDVMISKPRVNEHRDLLHAVM